MVARLRAAGCVFAEDEAALLRAHLTPELLTEVLARRVAGEPLEHLLGFVEIGGLRLSVGPGTFVPRQRTLGLAEEAVRRLPAATSGDGAVDLESAPVLVDLCAGVGVVAALVERLRPEVETWSVEIDPVAACHAARNVRGRVLVGDLDDPLPAALAGRVDVLTCNAPYVPTAEIAMMPPEAREHEPLAALDGGADGVDLHRRLLARASHWLAPTGILLIESTAPQVALVASSTQSADLTVVAVTADRDLTLLEASRGGREAS